MNKEPPVLHPNAIDAIYIEKRNKGQYYWPSLGGSLEHIEDWRERQLIRYERSQREIRNTETG